MNEAGLEHWHIIIMTIIASHPWFWNVSQYLAEGYGSKYQCYPMGPCQ